MQRRLPRPRARLARALTIAATIAATALAAAGCAGPAAEDRPETDARLVLDFTPNAAHTGIYTAVARGFDEAEGVNLDVKVPGSSTDGGKLLLSGRADFAVMDLHDLALQRERGRDLVAIMGIVHEPLASVLAAPDVARPRDLAGEQVGVTGVPSDTAVLRSIVAGDGGDPDDVEQVTIGFNAVAALLGGRVAGATAFWNVEGVALRQQRPQTKVFRLGDYGAPAYPELVLVTSGKALREDPSEALAAVRALMRGYDLTARDPESSISDLTGRVRGLDRGQLERQLDVLGPALAPPGRPIGALDPEVLNAWGRWEARVGIVRRPVDVAAAFDLSVVADAARSLDDD
jgi:putative hydroxymethylpyrimidine transport system substrate-binding protein